MQQSTSCQGWIVSDMLPGCLNVVSSAYDEIGIIGQQYLHLITSSKREIKDGALATEGYRRWSSCEMLKLLWNVVAMGCLKWMDMIWTYDALNMVVDRIDETGECWLQFWDIFLDLTEIAICLQYWSLLHSLSWWRNFHKVCFQWRWLDWTKQWGSLWDCSRPSPTTAQWPFWCLWLDSIVGKWYLHHVVQGMFTKIKFKKTSCVIIKFNKTSCIVVNIAFGYTCSQE